MQLTFSNQASKDEVFKVVEKYLHSFNLSIIAKDEKRPWGGFLAIDEKQSGLFIETFFANVAEAKHDATTKISPKILLVAPQKRLSWQYHFRRSEIWKLIGGTAGVATSESDEENAITDLKMGDIITLRQGERHRLIGKDGWGIVAEIWQHTDLKNPSDEDDIVRLQDDFGR